MSNEALIIIGGALVTVLNAGIAFFLKSIHGDFKRMIGTMNDHQEWLAVLDFRVSQLDGQPTRVRRRQAHD